MLDPDPYELIGVSPAATPEQIARAYRGQVRRLHPDLHPDDPQAAARLAELTRAYRLLADPARRSRYDRQHGYAGRPLPGRRIPVTRRAGRPGPDAAAEVWLDRADALAGVTATVDAPGHDVPVRLVQIPAGVHDGERIRIRGAGDPGVGGGRAGDLYLTVRIKTDAGPRTAAAARPVTVPITFPEAVLGTRVRLHLDRRTPVQLDIPPGTASGATLRIPGDADLLVTVVIDVPSTVSAGQRAALAALAATLPDPRAEGGARRGR